MEVCLCCRLQFLERVGIEPSILMAAGNKVLYCTETMVCANIQHGKPKVLYSTQQCNGAFNNVHNSSLDEE